MSGLKIENITKTYGDTMAVNNITVEFEPNTIYGLLGRNGAGKSTLLSMISNRIFPTTGTITLDGKNAIENDQAQRNIYCMSDKNLYGDLKVKEALKWSKAFYPNYDSKYEAYLVEKFGLPLKKKANSLSTGYSSIFKIIIALSCNAPYILLDEPVLGLDANHRDYFYKELIESYSNSPKTYIISTHLIEEVSSIIEKVVLIDKGSVIVQGDVDTLLEKGATITGPANLVDSFIQGKKVINTDQIGGLKTAYLKEKIAQSQLPTGLEMSKLNLQNLFIQLTNEKED